jgi:hypothetical protein
MAITTTGAATYGNRDEEDEYEEAVLAAAGVGAAAVREAAHNPVRLQTGNARETLPITRHRSRRRETEEGELFFFFFF